MLTWIRKNKVIWGISFFILFLILIGSTFYLFFGHDFIKSWYEGNSILFLKGKKKDIKAPPIDYYFNKADSKFRYLFFGGIIFTFFVLLFGLWIKSLNVKKLFWTFVFLLLIQLSISLINAVRINFLSFENNLKRILLKTEVVKEKAKKFEQNNILKSLGLNHMNQFYYRLDDHTNEAFYEANNLNKESYPDKYIFRDEFLSSNSLILIPKKAKFSLINGMLKLKYIKGDYLESRGIINIDHDRVGEIELKIKMNKGKTIQLGWSKSDDASWEKDNNIGIIAINTIADSSFHIYKINAKNVLKRKLEGGESIKKIFMVPSDFSGDEIEVDYIRFVSKKDKYSEIPFGYAYETINQEMRRVLFVNTPSVFKYSCLLPEKKVYFNFGLGILEQTDPVRLDIYIDSKNDTHIIFSIDLNDNNNWYDTQLDLSKWAGEKVDIVIKSNSKNGNIAFISNPIIYTTPQDRLNVIIILEDALRVDDMSCYGYKIITTPFKNKFMKNGVLFLNAFSQATMTRPSCPSFMTSLYPSATGVWSFRQILDDRYLTLAEIMRHQGFATASFIQNGNAGPYAGLHQGFSFLYDEGILKGRSDEILGDKLHNWIISNRDRNFFLYLHLIDPHGPYNPPSPFDSIYKDFQQEKTIVGKNHVFDPNWVLKPSKEGRRLLYDGEIKYNDYCIENFIEFLNKQKILKNSLIIFIADHGEFLGEHNLWGHHPPGYRQVTHVPLLMVYPKVLPENIKIENPVQLIDIMPTILDLAKIKKNDLLLEGDSLLTLINGENGSFWNKRIVISEEAGSDMGHGSIYYKNWHILYSDFSRMLRPLYFPNAIDSLLIRVFNFLKDNEENHYFNSFFVDTLFKFRIKQFMKRCKKNNMEILNEITEGTADAIKYDPEVLDRLKALGYIK